MASSGVAVESLLSEVRPWLPYTQHLKAADEAFFGERQLYTDITLASGAASTSKAAGGAAEAGHGKKDKSKKEKGGGRGGGQAGGVVDTVKEAINSAKRTVENALNLGGGDDSDEDDHSGMTEHGGDLRKRVAKLEAENKSMRKELDALKAAMKGLDVAGGAVEATKEAAGGVLESASGAMASAYETIKEKAGELASKVMASTGADEKAADEDFDLFGSDEDDEESAEQKRVKEERLAAYAAKKAKKPGPIAKSSVILDIKPWDDTTDLGEMEQLVKSIEQDGLLWGATKRIPLAYGIFKLQIVSTIEDEKVSVDELIEKIQDEFADHVQSVDIVAFNKI